MTRVLCFSDLHRDQDAARRLVTLADEVDVVIGAGDFANRHQGLADTLDILASIDRPSVLVPGNGETADELTEAAEVWASAKVLHGSGARFDSIDLPFWGVGGGIPVTPFGDWSYDFDELAGAAMLESCPTGGILVTHSPALDTVDHDAAGKIRGSESIRDCIQRCQPVVAVCGHIHSDWTKTVRLGETLVLNAGPGGMVVRIEDGRAEVTR